MNWTEYICWGETRYLADFKRLQRPFWNLFWTRVQKRRAWLHVVIFLFLHWVWRTWKWFNNPQQHGIEVSTLFFWLGSEFLKHPHGGYCFLNRFWSHFKKITVACVNTWIWVNIVFGFCSLPKQVATTRGFTFPNVSFFPKCLYFSSASS